MRWTEPIEEPGTGKLSATRISFLLWSVGGFIGWCAGKDLTWELLSFILALAGVQAWRRQHEVAPNR